MSLASILTHASATQTIHQLHDQGITIAQRKYLLNTVLYPELARIMERITENTQARPSLIASDLLAFDLLEAPLPPRPATSKTAAVPTQEAGSLFSLIFRTATFPPAFRAAIGMLPPSLQQMLRRTPVQALPPWFRAKVVQARGGQGFQQGGGAMAMQQGIPSAPQIESLEVSLYEYYFLTLACFLLQADVWVVAPPVPLSQKIKPIPPPTPDQYTDGFLKLIEHYLEFFLPRAGRHPEAMHLEENGWNVPAILQQHGPAMLETLVNVWFGQFSFEAAQQVNAPPSGAATPGGGLYPSLNQPLHQHHPHAYIPPNEDTLPTKKLIGGFQSIIYHLLELDYMEPPRAAMLSEVTATRASIMQYQQSKYEQHAVSPLVRLRVDWHLFGVLQHCFHRWASEWSTPIGVPPTRYLSLTGDTSFLNAHFAPTSSRLDDRLTKLIETWLDYIEPWSSIYQEPYNPHIWRWWIVSNLPFYTILLRDFLRLLTGLDLGRENTTARVIHLKTVLHVLAIFSGGVLEDIQEVESLTVKQTVQPMGGVGGGGATGGGAGGHGAQQANQAANQLLQHELFVVRSALQNFSGLRPENYVPVFPQAGQILAQASMTAGARGGLARTPTNAGLSPRGTPARSSSIAGTSQQQALKLESQSLAHTLIQQWSIGYSSPSDLPSEKDLLEAKTQPDAPQRKGDPSPPLSPSLLQQEERAGQLMEKRLRDMFGLEHEGGRAAGAGERRGSVTADANLSLQQSDRASAPSRFDQLLPEVEPLAAGSTASPRSRPISRLTASGRAALKSGRALCLSKHDVPVLGEEWERPVCTYEYATLVDVTRTISAWIREKTGRKVDLRFMASQGFVNVVLIVVALLFLLLIMKL